MNDLTFDELLDAIMNNPNTGAFLQTAIFVAAAAFGLLLLGRLLLGGRGNMISNSVSAAMGILMIYVVTIAFRLSGHYELFLTALPYTTISATGDYIQIFSFQGAGIQEICVQLVNMMILAFLVGIIDDIVPEGNGFFTWWFFRCLSTVLGMIAHWFITDLFATYLPGVIVTYAPVIILILMFAILALTVFSFVIGTLLGLTLNPILGAFYTFFLSNTVGKALMKASLTTILLTALVYALDWAGIHAVYLTAAAVASFAPVLLLVVVIWYLVFKFF